MTMTPTNGVKSTLKKTLEDDYSIRKQPATILIEDESIQTTIGVVFLNLLLIKSLILCDIKIGRCDIFNESVTQGSLENYFNHVLKRFQNSHTNVDYDVLRDGLAETINEMSDISGEKNIRVGNSISYRDLVRLSSEDSEASELFNPDVKPGSFHDIENQFNNHGKKLQKYFGNRKDSELNSFIRSKTGINIKQLTQLLGFVGLKPDIDGSVIPVVITDNFLNGLTGLESYYIVAKGTRKALMTNNRMTRKSGYLTRKLSLSNIDHYHNNDEFDCGTKHFVIFSVDNSRKLRQIVGRHYYKLKEDNTKLSDEIFTVYEDSNELIGTKIGLRSPMTCCSDKVCATCYGRELSAINKHVNSGLVAVNKLTEPLTQRLLSAKHLLTTNSEKVEWGEQFLEVFNVNMDSIYFNMDVDCSISFKKPTSEDIDEEENMHTIDSFDILFAGTKKSIHFVSPVKLLVNQKHLPVEKMKDDDPDISISSKNVDENEFVFKYQSKNAELTKSLQQILDLIETTDHLGISEYNEFINKFDDLLIENNLDNINSVHIEMISSVLIRDKETGKRLDFSKEKLDEYEIIRVSKSIMEGPLAVSLAFERLNDQFINLKTYEKDEISMMDNLFL